MHGTGMAISAAICYDRVSECIEYYNPDLIVSTPVMQVAWLQGFTVNGTEWCYFFCFLQVSVHPLMQHVPMKVLLDRLR